MIGEIIKKFISPKPKQDFSSFFNDASVEEKRKLMENVVRQANKDQRAMFKKYEQGHPRTA